MKNRRIVWILGVLTLALGLLVAGCGTSADNSKVLKVGTDATYAPFGFKDKEVVSAD